MMVSLCESDIHPAVRSCSPLSLSLAGVRGGPALTAKTFNMFRLTRIGMHMGLVAKNAFPLVDFTSTLRALGAPPLPWKERPAEIRIPVLSGGTNP